MKLVKTLVAAAALAVSSFTAQASVINVGGVSWNPDTLDDLSGFANYVQQFIAADGSLSGYGIISTINDSGPLLLGYNQLMVQPGWELTFQFGGFSLAPLFTTPTATGQSLGYTGGWLNIYVDSSADVGTLPNVPSSYNWTNTGLDAVGTDSKLWLSLVAVANPFTNLTLSGNTTNSGASGSGSFAVTGGLAASNFDTNTAAFGGDINFNSSFTKSVSGLSCTLQSSQSVCRAVYANMYGNANFDGDTIPEPSSLAVLGLGLLGLAGVSRRKNAK